MGSWRCHPLATLRVLLCISFALALCAAPSRAADPAKTLRVALSIAETTFDPAFASDAASDDIIGAIFDAMLDYDYLARPVKLIPRALEALPTVEDGGKAYLCKVRKGIYFTPDPVFKGVRRELTAADFAYGIKRILDPIVKSPWVWMLEGKLQGGDEARARATKSGRFDYDAPIAGLEVVDRYTLRIRLNAPDLRFPYVLALPNVAAQAREVVEAYGADIGAHPVGTGPYMLGEYRRSNRIVLVANPTYRESRYEPAGPMPEASQAVAAALKGRLLPLTSRVEVNIIEEGQARWLAFMNRELDFLDILPVEFTEQALDARGNLLPDLAKRGIVHDVLLRPEHMVVLFQHGGPGGRRLHAGEDRASPRDRMAYDNADGDSRAAQRPRSTGQRADPARHRGLRPDPQDAGAALRSGARARAARSVQLQGSRRRRLSRDARRQAARDRALVGAELGDRGRATSCGRRTWMRSASGSC